MKIDEFFKKFRNLNIKTITTIQIAIATVISLLFQFVFPLTWQPLDVATHGENIKHGDPGMNFVIATMSQWFFSFSIAWFIKRDNPYINNFLIYSMPSLSLIFVVDLVKFFLWWDYIHFFPLAVDIYLLLKKRDTLHQMWLPFYLILDSTWLFTVYFLSLAYYEPSIGIVTVNWLILTVLGVALSFTFHDSYAVIYFKKSKTAKRENKKE